MTSHDGNFGPHTMARRVYDYLLAQDKWRTTLEICLGTGCPNVSTRISEARRQASRNGLPDVVMRAWTDNSTSPPRQLYSYKINTPDPNPEGQA